jgi:hydrogenase/urease accessory protein HupE
MKKTLVILASIVAFGVLGAVPASADKKIIIKRGGHHGMMHHHHGGKTVIIKRGHRHGY